MYTSALAAEHSPASGRRFAAAKRGSQARLGEGEELLLHPRVAEGGEVVTRKLQSVNSNTTVIIAKRSMTAPRQRLGVLAIQIIARGDLDTKTYSHVSIPKYVFYIYVY